MSSINEIAGKNPFKVPEDYFEEVNRRIISTAKETEPVKVRPSLPARLRPFLAAAAAAAVLTVTGLITTRILTRDKAEIFSMQIGMKEVLADPYLNDIDILTLEENAGAYLFKEEIPEVNREDIIEFLILENIDINEIYEHL